MSKPKISELVANSLLNGTRHESFKTSDGQTYLRYDAIRVAVRGGRIVVDFVWQRDVVWSMEGYQFDADTTFSLTNVEGRIPVTIA